MSENENELVIKAAAGDDKAFGDLIIPYEKPVYNFCLRMIGDSYDAQDISQEVFIKIFKNIKKYRQRKGVSFKSWVFAIANNACIDEFRRRKSRIRPESLDRETEAGDEPAMQIESHETAPDEAVIKKERHAALRKAISDLPEDFKRMIILRELRGLSYEEISQATGLNIGTVKSKISRARDHLSEQLKKIYV